MGKTESVLNVLCARLDDDPVPALYVGPTRSIVEKVIEPRLMAALKSASRLWNSMARTKMGKTSKRISGVLVRLGWAGSASELAAQEAGLGIIDEIDRMELDVEGEGSPIELVDARLATFADGKLVLTSTPSEGNVVEERNEASGLTHWKLSEPASLSSAIWKLWQDGSRHEWAWPCPECAEYFIPRFSLIKWTPSEGATPGQAYRTARMVCPGCGALIEDSAKKAMNSRGVFVAPGQSIAKDGTVSGPESDMEHVSYWVSGLCSPWRSFGHRARQYLSAVRSGDFARIKTAVNTALGELYRIAGEAPEWQAVKKRAGGYMLGQLPAETIVITCGVDVQKTRLIYAVRAWGYSMESWLVEFGELYGDTGTPEPWTQLREGVLDRDFGEGLRIRKCAIDSGYKPGEASADNIVYRFVRENAAQCVAVKGHDSLDKPFYASKIDVRESGKTIAHGLQLWHVHTDYFKSFVHGRLKQAVGQRGEFHLPVDVTEDYCQQLVAESRVTKASGRATWIKVRKDNHALDCEMMNVAAMHMMGGHMLRRPAEKKIEEAGGTETGNHHETPATPSPPRRTQLPRGNWATDWRR